MKYFNNISFLILTVTLISCSESKPVDLIVHNSTIYTVNDQFETAKAMVVKDGKIIAIGAEHEIMNRYYSPNTIDAKKYPIYPLFVHYQNTNSFTEKTTKQLNTSYSKNNPISTNLKMDSINIVELLSNYGHFLKGTNDKRWSIVNAELTPDSLLYLYKKYNILPVVQSKNDNQKEKYSKLLKQNGLIVLNSFSEKESPFSISSFYYFTKNSTMSRNQILKGMTIWSAIANFEENKKGSLEVGKCADFVILDNDIMQTKPQNILSTKILQTFVGGENILPENK